MIVIVSLLSDSCLLFFNVVKMGFVLGYDVF